MYESFPIPLINRLEKHFLVMSTILNERQSELSKMINNWAEEFSNLKFGRLDLLLHFAILILLFVFNCCINILGIV